MDDKPKLDFWDRTFGTSPYSQTAKWSLGSVTAAYLLGMLARYGKHLKDQGKPYVGVDVRSDVDASIPDPVVSAEDIKELSGEAEVSLVLRLPAGQVPGKAPENAPEEAEQAQDPEHAAQSRAPDEQGEQQKYHGSRGEKPAQPVRTVSPRHHPGQPFSKSHMDRPFRLCAARRLRAAAVSSLTIIPG